MISSNDVELKIQGYRKMRFLSTSSVLMTFLSGFVAWNFIQHIKIKQTFTNDFNCVSQIFLRNHEGRGEPNPVLKNVRKTQKTNDDYDDTHTFSCVGFANKF